MVIKKRKYRLVSIVTFDHCKILLHGIETISIANDLLEALKVGAILYDTRRDLLHTTSCTQQSCIVYPGLKLVH